MLHADDHIFEQHLPILQTKLRGFALKMHGCFGAQPLTCLSRSGTQRRAMNLQRRAGDGGTLVGRQRGVTHQQMHFVYRHVQLFGHQLR